MSKVLFVSLLSCFVVACTNPSTLLVNREGNVMRCATTGYGYGLAGAIAISAAEAAHSRCVI